jgi:hypothetical protein
VKIDDIKPGDTLVNTDKNGTGYYRVLKVLRVNVYVLHENGNCSRMRPHLFSRKVNYPVAAFASEDKNVNVLI